MQETLSLWNTLGRKRDDVRPIHPDGTVRIYHCGPTVYASPHLGNLRRFLVADLLVRTAQFLGLRVRSVMNITDVGHLLDTDHEAAGVDRMVLAARREKLSPEEIAAKYTREFFQALTALHAEPAQYYPRATMHIPQMIEITRRLLEKGLAYETSSGVYQDVTKIPAYGKLSGNTVEATAAGARVDVREEKRHPADFALWIKAPQEHLMQWDAPWGRGYPGWHIECSAMAIHALGETLDIHTGGEDNIFPHHENELAQSEGATGKPFARIWLHNAHLLVEDKKMSKSAGTFITLQDIRARSVDPLAFRLLVLQTHYRSKLHFSWNTLDAARDGLLSLKAFAHDLWRASAADKTSPAETTALVDIAERRRAFTRALADDLGSPSAVAVIFALIRAVNPALQAGTLAPQDARALLDFLRDSDRVLALLDVEAARPGPIPDAVRALLVARETARIHKDFTEADRLRREIRDLGYELDDTNTGPRLLPRDRS